jgi:hypothetical protein
MTRPFAICAAKSLTERTQRAIDQIPIAAVALPLYELRRLHALRNAELCLIVQVGSGYSKEKPGGEGQWELEVGDFF